uniref:Pheromone receptor Rcb2 B44 n=1 Tax=Mycena chlorophos TaxID=658473 RepID=A0ABQ0MD72_MYCCL|nr:pheromone receptor Rcb2 B44 [Mycena chlorophos]
MGCRDNGQTNIKAHEAGCFFVFPATPSLLRSPIHDPVMHNALPFAAFLGAILVLVPLPWHWRARNVPTLSIIAWVFISNIIVGTDAILWADSIEVFAQVWCDISTKLRIGATMALPACCLCLCIHLERIASVRQVQTTLEQKRRRMLFDLAMCWGLPALIMALHYIVQGHRFDIIQEMGCLPTIYISIAAICLFYVPILVVIVLTLGFASAALYHFFRRRLTFARHLQDSAAPSGMTPSRYFRLMAMALVQMIWATSVTVSNMYFTILMSGIRPWISWANVHSDWSRVGVFPRSFVPANIWSGTLFAFWAVPITSVLFFVFFAFGRDAVKEYQATLGALRRLVRLPPKEPKKARIPSIPTFVSPYPAKMMEELGRPSDVQTLRSSASTITTTTTKGLPSYALNDIPMTPQSGSSFHTVIAAYEEDRPSRSRAHDSFYKPPPPNFPADVGDMA